MKTFKQIVLRLFFVVEIVVFSWLFIIGKNGIVTVVEKKKEILKERLKVADVTGQVASLEKQIDNWKTNSFYQEKLAREKLQMARAGERVFFVG